MFKLDKDYIYVPIRWKREDLIKVLRTINNMTPQKLCVVTDIPRYVLYEYEHGWRSVPKEDAEKLAKALKVDSWMFDKEQLEIHPVFGEWVTMA